MNFLRCLVFLYFTSVLAFGQSSQHNNPSTQPKAIVQHLYREVIARHPIGIPGDADMKIFAPYLSKALLHKINLAIACSADEARQHPDPNLKPEIAWLESGLFSGDNEQASPRTFHIERTQLEREGSFRAGGAIDPKSKSLQTWVAYPLRFCFMQRVGSSSDF
jgi:hypothetical protein